MLSQKPKLKERENIEGLKERGMGGEVGREYAYILGTVSINPISRIKGLPLPSDYLSHLDFCTPPEA